MKYFLPLRQNIIMEKESGDVLKNEDIQNESYEKQVEALDMVDAMCAASLDPDTFDKWDQVRNKLIMVRKAFKDKNPRP